MLNLVEFEENLREELEKHTPVITSKANKYGYGNVTAFVLETGSNVRPVVYPAILYKDYENGVAFSEIVKGCVGALKSNDVEVQNILSTLQNKEELLDMIIPRVLYKGNFFGDFYKTVPWSDDIIVAYYYEYATDSRKCSILLDYANMDRFGISEKEVEEAAMKNIKEKKFFISNVEEMMFSLANGERISDTKRMEIKYPMPKVNVESMLAPMFVVNGATSVWDSNVLLRDDILQMLYEYLGGSYVIMPSSTHEILVVPLDGNSNYNSQWSSMVSDVNGSMLKENDILSYNSYIFNGAKIEQL